MTRNKSSRRSLTPQPGAWGGFINIRLSDADKDAFHQWFSTLDDDPLTGIFSLVLEGYKFSLSYAADGEYWTTSLTGEGLGLTGIVERCCLTARAPQVDQAIALLLYKHVVIAKGSWASFSTSIGGGFNFG